MRSSDPAAEDNPGQDLQGSKNVFSRNWPKVGFSRWGPRMSKNDKNHVFFQKRGSNLHFFCHFLYTFFQIEGENTLVRVKIAPVDFITQSTPPNGYGVYQGVFLANNVLFSMPPGYPPGASRRVQEPGRTQYLAIYGWFGQYKGRQKALF